MNINIELAKLYMDRGIIDEHEMNTMLSEASELGMTIDAYMLKTKARSEREVYSVLSEFYCMPYVQMEMLDPDDQLVRSFSVTFLRKNCIVPITVDASGTMVMAIGRPFDLNARSAARVLHRGPVEFIMVLPEYVEKYLNSAAAVKSTADALVSLQKEREKKAVASSPSVAAITAPTPKEEEEISNAPAVRLVDSIIKEAIPFRASDIHIEPFENIVKVRYRIDGDLADRAEFPIESFPAICARIKILSGIDIAERRIPQDGRINLSIEGKEYDFRVSTLPTIFGEKFVIRILDKTSFNFTRKDLGFSEDENKVVDKILAHPHGIVLLTGPTGCGKSTTLYSFLKEINKPEVNIVTVEDPVEYTLMGINQTQVNTKANMTFAAALRSILRQDPDIIMIGEIRDEETAQIAIRAAITGHLVFSTLHTNDAPGVINRLVDMGVKGYLVEDSLIGVISQRLVKQLCPMCKIKTRTNRREMEVLHIDEPATIYRPQGCQYCNNSGYRGRIAVHEIMYMTDKLRDTVGRHLTAEEVREIARSEGMKTLWEACRERVYAGDTSISELMTLSLD